MFSLIQSAFRRPRFVYRTPDGAAGRFGALPLPGLLRIDFSKQISGFPFAPLGEFPRRVREGEVIARAGDFPLLAPMPGILDLAPDAERFILKVEGNLQLGKARPGERPIDALLKQSAPLAPLLDLIRDSGLASLEFPALRLDDALRTTLQQPRPLLILARVDPEGAIDWPQLFAERATDLEELAALFARLAPGVEVAFAPRKRPEAFRAQSFAARPERLPEALIRALAGDRALDLNAPFAEQGVCFLGPATLWALCDALFEGRPFTSRPAATLRFSAGGKLGAARLVRAPNGADLQELLGDEIALAGGVIAGDPVFHQQTSTLPESSARFNIFRMSSFYATPTDFAPLRGANLSCTGCFACQAICPTGANPLSLLEQRVADFGVDHCVECGLCEYVCESGIGFSSVIRSVRSAAGKARSSALRERHDPQS